jgi:hypothetical protein
MSTVNTRRSAHARLDALHRSEQVPESHPRTIPAIRRVVQSVLWGSPRLPSSLPPLSSACTIARCVLSVASYTYGGGGPGNVYPEHSRPLRA